MDGEVEDVEDLNSMRQVKELFAQMRNLFRKLEHEAKTIQTRSDTLPGGSAPTSKEDLERRKTLLGKDGVGDLEEIGEFGLGLAPRMSKPVNKIEISKTRQEMIDLMQADDDDSGQRFGAQGEEEEDSNSQMEILRLKK